MKKLIFLAIGMFTVGCSSFIIAGLLPQIGQTLGQPIAITGQGITLFSLAYLFSAPLFSIIFANQSVKRIIQFALIVLVLGNLITLFSENIVSFLIGRALVGMGAGIFTPLCFTIAIHCVNPSAKGRVLSFFWSANSAGVVFGVPLGLYLSSLFHWQSSLACLVALGLITFIGFSFQNLDISLPKSPSLGERLRLFADREIMSVIGITCFTTLASLGLYSYVAPIQSGSPNSLAMTLFAWGLGGFIGSSIVGICIDRTKKPQMIMAMILVGLMLTFIAIPFTKNITYLGLIPFFLWGAFGWATTTPQQHILFELHEKQGSILAALNASAIGLGSALGTAMGGAMIVFGLNEINLPFLAASLLLIVFICQLMLIKNSTEECRT